MDNRVKTRLGFTVGTSGQLLLATGKEDGHKYLVKHEYPHNAANEYFACWMAEKLGIPAPRAWLLSPNAAFNSKYAVAIEFIEGLTGFDKMSVPEELQEELIGQFAFHALIGSADIMQLNAADGHIYSYDFSEAFYFDNDLNTWYLAVLGQQALPVRWLLLAVSSLVISLSVSFVVFKLSTRKQG